MSKSEIFRTLSPLGFFIAHLVYLVGWSPEPFLSKWIDGCFSFFLSLVMCNIIRARIAAKAQSGEGGDESEHDPGGPDAHAPP